MRQIVVQVVFVPDEEHFLGGRFAPLSEVTEKPNGEGSEWLREEETTKNWMDDI